VLGIVDPPAILRWRRAGKHRKSTLGDLLRGQMVSVAYPDEYLESLSDKLSKANVSHLPIIARDSSRLVGYVGLERSDAGALEGSVGGSSPDHFPSRRYWARTTDSARKSLSRGLKLCVAALSI